MNEDSAECVNCGGDRCMHMVMRDWHSPDFEACSGWCCPACKPKELQRNGLALECTFCTSPIARQVVENRLETVWYYCGTRVDSGSESWQAEQCLLNMENAG